MMLCKQKGGTYNDKKVTEVYTGFTTTEYDETTIPWYTYRASIKKVEFIDEIKPTSLARWFRGFSSCIEMNLKKLNTSNVTSLYFTFDGMSSLTTLDISNFDISSVTNMSSMFEKVARNNANFVLDLGDKFKFKEGVTVTNFASSCGAGKLTIPQQGHFSGL